MHDTALQPTESQIAPERWAKLPAFARQEIERLRMVAKAAQDELRLRREDNPATRIYVDRHPTGGRIYLSERYGVSFRLNSLDEKREREITVQLRPEFPGMIYLSSNDALQIHPWSSNVAIIGDGRAPSGGAR